jgi:hypothetical protein
MRGRLASYVTQAPALFSRSGGCPSYQSPYPGGGITFMLLTRPEAESLAALDRLADALEPYR